MGLFAFFLTWLILLIWAGPIRFGFLLKLIYLGFKADSKAEVKCLEKKHK